VLCCRFNLWLLFAVVFVAVHLDVLVFYLLYADVSK
jgi:hypothetical protein